MAGWIAWGHAWVAHAQDGPTPPDASVATLKQAFDRAWSRQPEAAAWQMRRDAAAAQREAAAAWTPEPLSLALSNKTDRLQRNRGTRELEAGIAVPLWLPGERARSGAVAEAESSVVESRVLAARWRVAGVVRDAYWQWHRARIDLEASQDQVANARRLGSDVARRVKAGDLARADQHHADGAIAAAESAMAQATATAVAAEQQLRALVGHGAIASIAPTSPNAPNAPTSPTSPISPVAAEPEPLADASTQADPGTHPAARELLDRAAAAERNVALIAVRSRGNPELTLMAGRERDAAGESYNPTVTIGLRIPLGDGNRHVARTTTARADAIELEAQAELERGRIVADADTGRRRVESVRHQVAAADRRALLAQESRGFFDRSFRLGETDLPTRLRIETEATEASRQAARVRIDLAAAISQWRQALGLLPE